MLWLKAWMETRWKIVWMLLIGAFSLATASRVPASHPQTLLTALLALSVLFSLIVTIMLAGTGIETASTRPGESAKGGEGSKLFTLSLPVTRAWLFWVRTVTGVLETELSYRCLLSPHGFYSRP